MGRVVGHMTSLADGRETARELYLRYAPCMAFIEAERDGALGIGSAFHVGDGVFITARHVVEGARITHMALHNGLLLARQGTIHRQDKIRLDIERDAPRATDEFDGRVEVLDGPVFHPTAAVDVAAVRVGGMRHNAAFVPLGGHLDDWVGDDDFVLSEVLVMGFPPIPMTRKPHLIAVRGEVGATVDAYPGGTSQLHFIVSTMPRGGFSGGLAFSSWGFALGVVTESLVRQGEPVEFGYTSVTSVEAIYQCLASNGLLPEAQGTGWGDLWKREPSQ